MEKTISEECTILPISENQPIPAGCVRIASRSFASEHGFSMEKISFVIPVYNEEGNLVALCDEIRRVAAPLGRPFEVLLVDEPADELAQLLVGHAPKIGQRFHG